MRKDRTVERLSKPIYGIGNVAYLRISAMKGFLEPLIIVGVRYDRDQTSYLYKYIYNTRLSKYIEANGGKMDGITINEKDIAPIEVRENELINICDALSIQISFLERELSRANSDLSKITPPRIAVESAVEGIPKPKFGINEVVYLASTAEIVGRLEPMMIDAVAYDSGSTKWKYTFVFQQRPGENMTVGDRNDLKSEVVVSYYEDEITNLYEALTLSVSYLTQAVNSARAKRVKNCENVSEA